MRLFIGVLAFPNSALQNEVKVGILAGSLVSALCGAMLLSVAKREPRRPDAFAECRPIN